MSQVQKMICLLHNEGRRCEVSSNTILQLWFFNDFYIFWPGEKYKNKVLSSVIIEIKTYFDTQNIRPEYMCNN